MYILSRPARWGLLWPVVFPVQNDDQYDDYDTTDATDQSYDQSVSIGRIVDPAQVVLYVSDSEAVVSDIQLQGKQTNTRFVLVMTIGESRAPLGNQV